MEKEYDDLVDLIPKGYAVDVKAVEGLEVRSWIKGVLVAGGARIFGSVPEEGETGTRSGVRTYITVFG